MVSREACFALDEADPLRTLRDEFALDSADAAGLIYLDGNSLGPLPRSTMPRLAQVITDEWGRGLIRSWNDAEWITLAHRVGDKIARLAGAGPNEVVVADSTSVNLYKILSAAIDIAKVDNPSRRHILSERTNFPSDLYIADTLARDHGFVLHLVDADELPGQLDDTTAVVLLTHVNYRTGRMHDLSLLTRMAHAVGALTVWDLCHSIGAVPLDLKGTAEGNDAADFAVGCGYKYPERRPGSSSLCMGASAMDQPNGPRPVAPAAIRLAGSRSAVRFLERLSPGGRHRAIHLRDAADPVAGGA